MDRKVFFSDGGVIISDSRFIASGYIYSIQDIIAVKLGIIEPPKGIALFGMTVGALLMFDEGMLFAVGGFLVAIGVMIWLFAKTNYAVLVQTATGEHKVLEDRSNDYIQQVIQALEAALANRGTATMIDARFVRESLHAVGSELPPLSPSR